MAALPKIEDFKTPWEQKGVDIDADKAKKFVYWQATQIQRLEDESAAKVKTLEEQLAKKTSDLDELKRKDESETDRIKRERDELKAKLDEKSKETSETIALDIIAEKHDVSIKDARFIARRARGDNKDEIEKDVAELVSRFSPAKKTEENEGETEGHGQSVKKAATPGGPKGSEKSSDMDIKDFHELFPRAF